MKKPHRKSVNLKDHDQLGKRNREERSLRERLSVANPHRIHSLIKKYVVSRSFRNSLYKIARLFLRYYSILSSTDLCTKNTRRVLLSNLKKKSKSRPLILLEIVSFATSSYAEQKSHYPPACLRGSRLERERRREKERKRGKKAIVSRERFWDATLDIVVQ